MERFGKHVQRLPMASPDSERDSLFSVFLAFLTLGCTSFGGPVAHIGYFRTEFVERRRWLSDNEYADLVALCQFLPGPASSQVGMGIGLFRRGLPGSLAAWLGFTLPSAVLMIGFALALTQTGLVYEPEMFAGLKVVAVAVVAQALWGMGRSLCPERLTATLAVGSALLALTVTGVWGQLSGIALGAAAGVFWLKARDTATDGTFAGARATTGWVALMLFAALLTLLPFLSSQFANAYVALMDSFYRVGALVFGGGHVVLPLLQAELVPDGWVSTDVFLAGYGAAQALPGPLFTFAGYLGAAIGAGPEAVVLGLLALVSIFLPGFLLLLAAFPLWGRLRRQPPLRRALSGINAAVVGLLLAALYDPVWTSAISTAGDFALALAAFAALMFWRLPPWLVVIATALIYPLMA